MPAPIQISLDDRRRRRCSGTDLCFSVAYPISQNISLPPWKPLTVFFYVPLWAADSISWPYALALSALAAAVILTSVVRSDNESMSWAGTLILCALGILAVAAANPLTLILAWSVIDLAELVIMLRSTEGEGQSTRVITAFSVRLGRNRVAVNGELDQSCRRQPAGFPLHYV